VGRDRTGRFQTPSVKLGRSNHQLQCNISSQIRHWETRLSPVVSADDLSDRIHWRGDWCSTASCSEYRSIVPARPLVPVRNPACECPWWFSDGSRGLCLARARRRRSAVASLSRGQYSRWVHHIFRVQSRSCSDVEKADWLPLGAYVIGSVVLSVGALLVGMFAARSLG